jgi:hypothetical protein
MDKATELIAIFRKPNETADAIDALLEAGITGDQIVVMSGVPYPEGALGRHVGGMLFGLFLAVITPHLYRLDVGGHPSVGFPPAAIIVFVFTMMATIISTFIGVLWEMNFPEFGPKAYYKRVTNGYLAVLVEFPDDLKGRVLELLEDYGAREIRTPERQAL